MGIELYNLSVTTAIGTDSGGFYKDNKSLDVQSVNSTDEYEYYDYDYDESFLIPLEDVIPITMVYGITILLGLAGNVLVIFSIAKNRKLRSITNVFLISLSSADLLLILICVPIKCASFLSFSWNFGWFLCKAVHYLQNVSMICSVTTLTAMSIERYVAIWYPLKAKYVCTIRHARQVIIVVWILSFIMAIPILFGQEHFEVGEKRKAYWCMKKWSRPLFSRLYEMYMLTVMLLIPLLVMALSYGSICYKLYRVTWKRADMRIGKDKTVDNNCYNETTYSRLNSGSVVVPVVKQQAPPSRKKSVKDNEVDKTMIRVVQMLVMVVVLFVLCWAPILINNVLTAFQVLDELHVGPLKPMRMAFFALSYVNSCVNPIVYAFLSKNFRDSFKYAICVCFRGNAFLRSHRHSMFTRSTAMSGSRTNASPMYDKDNSLSSENLNVNLSNTFDEKD